MSPFNFRSRFRPQVVESAAGTDVTDADNVSSSSANDEIRPSKAVDSEKITPVTDNEVGEGKDSELGGEKGISGTDGFADDDPRLNAIPWSVRRVVSLHDDTTLPTLTFRYFVLTILFVVPGAFLSQLSHFRTTSAPYSVFFVQIASNYVGLWLAKVLPTRLFKIPFTNTSFSLNPGPWSTKEHVLVTISAASGATYNLAYTPVAMAELYFGQRINAGVAIVFMWAVVWTGYSFAAISRQFLLYDPQYPWFQA